MKILMLVPYIPTITMSGGQTRWYNIIKHLAKKHEITLFSLIKDESERKFIPELKRYCKKVRVFKRPKKPWTLKNILLSIFSPFPLLVIRNQSLEERREIKNELEKNKYDLIHAETFYVMPHLGKTNIPTVLVEQTIWHDVYKNFVINNIPFILRPFFLQDVLKIMFWEKYYWGKADRLFSVSEEDRKSMLSLVHGKEVGIIPNGVDTKFYRQKKLSKKFPPRILYGVSNFEWIQNQDAVKSLIFEVWPLIKKKFEKVKVWIVGRKIPDWVKKISESGEIEITENIPDARDAYLSSSVMVVPIKTGGGTRLKVLEAMAAGLPVVSTKEGVVGLNLTNGKNVLIGNSAQELAENAVKILKNKKLAERISKEEIKHVKKYFDWKSIVKLHEPIYKQLVKKNG